MAPLFRLRPAGSTYARLRLILGDQLNERHSWLHQPDPDTLYLLVEARAEQTYVRHHVRKIELFFRAMRNFALHLHATGHAVHYLAITDPENIHASISETLGAVADRYAVQRVEWQLPDEYRLDRELADWAARQPRPTATADTEHFLTSRHEVGQLFGQRPHWLMETFYRKMRQRTGLLMDTTGKPLGGQWNYDAENRQKPPAGTRFAPPLDFGNDYEAIRADIVAAGLPHFGQSGPLDFPTTRAQALRQLAHFIDTALPQFGKYQDAMLAAEPLLNHSLLSFALNVKLITPLEVVERCVAAYGEAERGIGLAQVEGFVRQLIGWREYLRGVYWARMPDYALGNFLGHRRPLPAWYWTGETDLNCLRHAIGQSLGTGYAHHIQRLMVTGNYALLTGVQPAEVNAWYLGVYVDALEWVQLPNTQGMSQYADGGLVATKPYISSGAYLHKMSDYCRNCPYDVKQRVGPRACPFNALYWHFLERNRPQLEGNSRLAMPYRTWEKMSADDRRTTLAQAETWLADPVH